jgi:hypothetical protein
MIEISLTLGAVGVILLTVGAAIAQLQAKWWTARSSLKKRKSKIGT